MPHDTATSDDAPSEPSSDLSKVRRHPERASYDPAALAAVLDADSIAHVGFTATDRPVVIPMLYGRDGQCLYLHGSVASRLARTLATGIAACASVTVVDGLVLARSAFHHSMNYRSAVVFGRAVAVDADGEKVHGLRVITEHLVPGRWDEVREPTRLELRQTAVLRLDVEEASVKTRAHGVVDDDEDLALPIWAGVVPVSRRYAGPEADEGLDPSLPVPSSVQRLIAP